MISTMKLINIAYSIELLMSILVTSPCSESTVEELVIKNWPIWTCEVSSFDWTYDDKRLANCLRVK